MMFESFIQTLLDNGSSWTLTGNIHNHATYMLAFHPTDTNFIISGREGLIGKSNDRGLRWTFTDTVHIYIFDVKYDPANSNILYATGDYHGINDTEDIYGSVDGGNSWQHFYHQFMPDSDGALELHIYNNILSHTRL